MNQTVSAPSAVAHMFRGFHLKGLLRFLYIISPNETSFATVAEVPNYIDEAFPWFFAMIFIELVITKIMKKDHLYDAADSLTSIGAGLSQQIIKVITRSAEIWLYFHINKHYAIYILPWDSPWTWMLGFLSVDFAYYWFHRMGHEINLFWAAHSVHHSSQYYNLSTALRQGMVQQFTSFIFYLPFALFVPSPIHVAHTYFNLMWQFWIHTQLLKSLGPLEYILNTPSHHRVHHGRNPYCVDKNYGGTLIIFDRIFGTFEAEKPEEPVAYGLIHNVETYNPFTVQLSHLYHIFVEKIPSLPGIMNKLKSIVYGPGWMPGTPRLGDDDFPEVEKPVQVYYHPLPKAFVVYALFQYVIVTGIYTNLFMMQENVRVGYYWSLVGIAAFTMYSCSLFFDNKSYAPYVEVLRLALLEAFVIKFGFGSCVHKNMIAHGVLSASIAFWTIVSVENGMKNKTE